MKNPLSKISDDLKMQIYQDSIQKPLQSVSKTFSDVWFLVFGGISHIADKRQMKYSHSLDCYHQELFSEIKKIPEDKLIEPNVQVTAQALENSKYCIESQELRKMFVNLISKSINSDYTTITHPSFAEIIKQMSPTDAKILETIPLHENIPIVDYIVVDKNNSRYKTELENIYLSHLPHIDIFMESQSVSSLSRLGILNIDKASTMTDKQVYDHYKKTPFFNKFSKETCQESPHQKADLKMYLGNLTPLGRNFFVTCVL